MSSKRYPATWTLRQIEQELKSDTQTELRDGSWGPARPYPLVPESRIGEFKYRLKIALKVFRGECDALDWMQS